ncbi:MAG: hypothetical protein LBT46_03650 [Planctomycetaceae bacterium]|jgi:hypothetical protein|nr:hypothetical protein [Planctomycetaceae bacterium]
MTVTVLLAASFFFAAAAFEYSAAQEGKRINMFDTKPGSDQNKKPKKTKKTKSMEGDTESVRQMQQSFRAAFDDDDPSAYKSNALTYYGIFFTVLGCFIAGIFYWKFLLQKRAVQSLNNPVFLIKELNAAHQLTRDEISLMQKVSDFKTLPDALTLFVEPEYLLNALEDNAFAPSRHLISPLLHKLFGIDAAAVAGSSLHITTGEWHAASV